MLHHWRRPTQVATRKHLQPLFGDRWEAAPRGLTSVQEGWPPSGASRAQARGPGSDAPLIAATYPAPPPTLALVTHT
eukprot:3480114-Alexandrium_andersonii.AAC.1